MAAGRLRQIRTAAPQDDRPVHAHHGGQEVHLAVPVEDAWQRQGLGTALTERLLRQAQHADVPCVHADVLADNAAMLRVLRRTGDVVRRTE